MSNDRWEYKVVPAPTSIWGTSKPEAMAEALNREGAQGWELVSSSAHPNGGFQLFFKKNKSR